MMNWNKKITLCSFSLLAALIMICSAAVTALAADGTSLDFAQNGSVTLTLADSDGNPVSGGEVSIYEVASLSLQDGDMAYQFTDAFQNCTAALDITDASLAETLAQYVKEHSISGTTVSVGTDGTATFEGLELGLYLVIQTAESDHYETINPFVATVPIESDGVWVYTVDASPKVGTVTPIEQEKPQEEEEPSESEETTSSETEEVLLSEPEEAVEVTAAEATEKILPKTGQLNWPIPVLALCGLLFFTVGWFLKCTDKREKYV